MQADRPRRGSDWIAPDCAGMDFYAADRGLRDLLAIYLPAPVLEHLTPHFQRLGQLAGGRLDELARIADRHPPVLHARDRFGRDEDWIEYHPAYREMEQIAFGDFQFHAMSHRGGVLGMDRPLPPVAKYAFQYLFVQGEFGLMCPISVTDTSIHLIRKFGSNALQDYLLPRMLSADLSTLWKGTQFMTEKAGGSDVGAIETVARERGRRLAAIRREMVLLAYRCRRRADAGAAGGRAGRDARPGAVRAAAPDAGRRAQRLPDRPAEGQAGHASRWPAAKSGWKAPRPIWSAQPDAGPEADDGAGEPVAPVARRARRRDDAPLLERGAGRRARAHRVRPDGGRFSADAAAVDEAAGAGGAGAVDGAVHRRRDGARRGGGTADPDRAAEAARLPRQRGGRDRRDGGARRQRLHRGLGEPAADPRRPGRPAVGGHQQHQRAGCHRPGRRQGGGAPGAAGDAARAAGGVGRAAGVRFRAALGEALDRAVGLAERVAAAGEEALARQAATALYDASSAVLLAWEGSRPGADARRVLVARFVLAHRLSPLDPLAPEEADWERGATDALLGDKALGLGEVAGLIG